jgi:hypothetical protein
MTTPRPELALLDELADWHSHTEWQGEVNVGQLKLEVDMLAERELEDGAAAPDGATESRGTPPPAKPRGSAKTERLREDILRGAAFYDQHGQHNAAARAREIAAGLDTL